MGDNVTVTAGTGTTVAADEVADGTLGTVKVQYVKLMDGTLDGTTKAVVGANGLKVDASGTSVAVTGTFWQATQPISGTVTVTNFGAALTRNAGAADANTQRITIDTGQLGALGQTTMSASVPVAIASNQSSMPVAATLAAETTKVIGTVNVASTQLPAVGQAAMAASVPVAPANDYVPPIYALPANFVSGAITTAMTGTTSTSLVAAPGASLRNYLTAIIVSNAHATVGTDVVIQDGSGGTTLMTIPAAAVYGGAVITLPTPLRQPTTNTAIYCANVTTGASTKVSAVGYKAA